MGETTFVRAPRICFIIADHGLDLGRVSGEVFHLERFLGADLGFGRNNVTFRTKGVWLYGIYLETTIFFFKVVSSFLPRLVLCKHKPCLDNSEQVIS